MKVSFLMGDFNAQIGYVTTGSESVIGNGEGLLSSCRNNSLKIGVSPFMHKKNRRFIKARDNDLIGPLWTRSTTDWQTDRHKEIMQVILICPMLYYSNGTNNEEVRVRTGQHSIDNILSERRLRWIGHVIRMDHQRIPRQALALGGSRVQQRSRLSACKLEEHSQQGFAKNGNHLEKAKVAGYRTEWCPSVAQCIYLDKGWIKIKNSRSHMQHMTHTRNHKISAVQYWFFILNRIESNSFCCSQK